MTAQIRFGEVLIGQDFKLLEKPVVFRRTKGLFAAPVAHIGGHVDGHGSNGFPFERDLLVEPVVEPDDASLPAPGG